MSNEEKKTEKGKKKDDRPPGNSLQEQAPPGNPVKKPPAKTGETGEPAAKPEDEDITPSTPKQKIMLSIFLFIGTIILIICWYVTLKRVESKFNPEITVSWKASQGIMLKSGPPSFWHNRKEGKLYYRGVIDAERKKELIGLFPENEKNDGNLQNAYKDYVDAINKLAYESNNITAGGIGYLLLLAGISGTLGVMLRSSLNFIGLACWTNRLDLTRWWPWYVIRPLIGFLLGMLTVIVLESGLFQLESTTPSGTIWWVAVAVLAGFSTNEFSDRLRNLTKTLFGSSSKDS